MALRYENLDQRTRELMLEEVDHDTSQGTLYISPRLNDAGREGYERLLRVAIREESDEWLAEQLDGHDYIEAFEQRRTKGGGYTMARVPINAAETLAEGEFNRFYARGLCKRAIEDGTGEVEVYRGKEVSRPRAQSQAMIGSRIPAKALLEDLRNSPGVEPALDLPPGPNSGLTVRLPRG